MSLLIWWLSPEEMGAIGEEPQGLPDYVSREYQSLLGRGGLGRLWVDIRFSGAEISLPWPNDPIGRWCYGVWRCCVRLGGSTPHTEVPRSDHRLGYETSFLLKGDPYTWVR